MGNRLQTEDAVVLVRREINGVGYLEPRHEHCAGEDPIAFWISGTTSHNRECTKCGCEKPTILRYPGVADPIDPDPEWTHRESTES